MDRHTSDICAALRRAAVGSVVAMSGWNPLSRQLPDAQQFASDSRFVCQRFRHALLPVRITGSRMCAASSSSSHVWPFRACLFGTSPLLSDFALCAAGGGASSVRPAKRRRVSCSPAGATASVSFCVQSPLPVIKHLLHSILNLPSTTFTIGCLRSCSSDRPLTPSQSPA